MNKVLVTLMIALLPCGLHSQDYKWSMLPKDAQKKSETLINDFIKSFNNKEDLTKYFPEKEGNYGGQIWMPIKDYLGFINRTIIDSNTKRVKAIAGRNIDIILNYDIITG